MIDRTILPALTITGGLLLAAYAVAWVAALQDDTPVETAAAPEPTRPAGRRLYYRVTTPEGERHVIDVSPLDSGQALVIAAQRYGAGSTVEQIDAAQASREQPKIVPSPPVPRHTWLLGLLLLLPASMLLAASQLRSRVRALDAVWEALGDTLMGEGEAIMRATGLGARDLRRALDDLNAGRGLELHWDPRSDRIVDLRLAEFTLAVRYCPRCNAEAHVKLAADLSDVPSCQRCMAPFDGPEVMQQHAAIVQRLVEPPPGRAASRRSFSLPVFLFWSLLFPPLAAAYALRAAR